MENHAYDNFFGCSAGAKAAGEGIDGHTVPKDPSNLKAGSLKVVCGSGNYVCDHGKIILFWIEKP